MTSKVDDPDSQDEKANANADAEVSDEQEGGHDICDVAEDTVDGKSDEEESESIDESESDEGEESGDGEESEDGDESEVETLQRELEEARLAVQSAKDQSLRAVAEAENTRKRTAREVENAHKFALERFARELLPSLDNFDAAFASAEKAEIEQSDLEGFKLSVKSLLDTLERNGIVGFDPMGEVFDPEKHKALTVIEHADAEPGSVVDVIRKGYLLNDRLIREAEVVVSKEPEESDETASESSS